MIATNSMIIALASAKTVRVAMIATVTVPKTGIASVKMEIATPLVRCTQTEILSDFCCFANLILA
jgi:hypothetical protein